MKHKHFSRFLHDNELLVGAISIVAIIVASFYLGFACGQYRASLDIENVMAAHIGSKTATILFTTETPSAGYVHFSTNADFSSEKTIGGNHVRPLHYIDLQNLKPGTKYFYYITANDASGERATRSGTKTFTTLQ